MINMPWTQGMTYDEMPDETQEAVDRRAEVYSNQTFENGTVDDEEVALFYVGEDTMVEDVLDAVDYTDDNSGVIEGNVTAAAIERVADEVLESTDADSAVVWDRTEGTPVYQEGVDPENPFADRARPLTIVQEIGDHYEDIESEERAEAYEDQLRSALSEADPDVRQTVVQARQEAFDSMQEYEQEDDVEHPEIAAQRDMMQTIADSDVEAERVNEALESVDVNTDPVFARTMSSGYHMSRLEEKREQMQ